ncbi:MAG TPA: T9SS type A sorting domain-containing protein, partial [bacterium]
SLAAAQTYFKFAANTGNNASLAVPISAGPNILGTALMNGDEIGVFTPAGLCVGATVWNVSQNGLVTVWGDNDQTLEIDGLRDGEEMHFCLWRKSSNISYADVTIAYSMGNRFYSVNGIYVLSAATANAVIAPLPPHLALPENGAANLTTLPTLSWYTACGAQTYAVQVSVQPNFENLAVDQSGIGVTSFNFTSAANHTTYYWRVRASNSVGTSDWSGSRNFITGLITAVETRPPNTPGDFTLHQNYPNPFNAATVIAFDLPVASAVRCTLCDVSGRVQVILANGEFPAGTHRLRLDAMGLASGIYYYVLEANADNGIKLADTKKLIVLK